MSHADMMELHKQLEQAEAERDDLRTDYDALIARLERSWPRCPDGCGCLMDGEDADRRECGCDGPCTMECRENGYPDAPSYRDAAVKLALDERDAAREELTTSRERNAAIAVQLDQYRDERDHARAALHRISSRMPVGRHASPDECDAMRAIAAAALEATP